MLIQSTTCFNSDGSLPSTQNRKSIIVDQPSVVILGSGLMPFALEVAVLTILRPHVRFQDGASLVCAEGLHAKYRQNNNASIPQKKKNGAYASGLGAHGP